MSIVQFPVLGNVELPELFDQLYWDEPPHLVAAWLHEVLDGFRALALRVRHPKAFNSDESVVFNTGFHPSSRWVLKLEDRMRTVAEFASSAPELWTEALTLSRDILALHRLIGGLLAQRPDHVSLPRLVAVSQVPDVASIAPSRSNRHRPRGHSRRRANRGAAWRVPVVY